MSDNSFVNREQVEIHPLNPPPNGYSFRNGFPSIQFELANQPKFLVGSSVRLNGTLRICTAGRTEADPITPNNVNRAVAGGGTAVEGGRSTGNFVAGGDNTTPSCVALPERIGVNSCISQVTLSSQESQQTLETIRNYGRYLVSAMPLTSSKDDFDSTMQIKCLTASRSAQGAQLVNNDVSFCVPLATGLLRGAQAPIPLGTNGVRGLGVQIDLASDAQSLNGFWTFNTAAGAFEAGTVAEHNEAKDTGGAWFELRDVTLSYDLLVPDADGENRMQIPATGALTYNSVSSLYSVLMASDQSTSLNLNTRKTISVYHNTIPAKRLNNYDQNSFATPVLEASDAAGEDDPQPDEEVSFQKGGQLFPLDNILDVRWSPHEGGDPGDAPAFLTSDAPRPLTATTVNYANAVSPYSEWRHNLMSLNTQIPAMGTTAAAFSDMGAGYVTDVNCLRYQQRANTGCEPRDMHGYGIRQGPYASSAVDYSRTNYTIRVKSGLNQTTPNSLYTFVLAENVLQYSPQGVQVMS